jgi:hypothetical protein
VPRWTALLGVAIAWELIATSALKGRRYAGARLLLQIRGALKSVAKLLVNVDVDDLEKAVGFYSAALGSKVGRRFGVNGAEMLGAPHPFTCW